MKRQHVWLVTTFVLIVTGMAARAETLPRITIDQVEMAGISGFREFWDRPVVVAEGGATRTSDHGRHGGGLVADWTTEQPGAPVFDAIHRSLLLRFPAAAETIAAALAKGGEIARVDLVLPYVDIEFFPMHYRSPSGMSFMGDLWVRLPPRWHAVAWPLRQPWRADRETGPTYNASVNGRRYWSRFGAQQTEQDRYPVRFGPTEVSPDHIEGRMEITALLNDEAYGATLAARLRAFADQGLIVRKWETYDARYNHGGYEYGGAPGHRGIRIGAPRLEVTFREGKTPPLVLAAAVDPVAAPAAGQPTAVNLNAAEIAAVIARYGVRQPSGMPDWQWQRVRELIAHGGGHAFAATPQAYAAWLDELLGTPYRMFMGHHTPLMAEHYLLYGAAMPEPVREHLRRYFEGWLLPGKPYHELTHNQWGIWIAPENSYYARTGDWRGNHSFYRDSYTRFMSTMNFNHLAATGALLGGAMIDDPYALDDGRHALEVILARLWSWYDGTTQESIDHYYLGLTLLAQKTFADLGPSKFDRMLGRSILMKTVEELAACYHPALRRFISPSGRTGIAYLLGVNEGPNAILHTLSRQGALHDVANPERLGMPAFGQDLPPGQVGLQTLRGPWAPLWMANLVDDKPLPFQMTATFKMWGAHREKPLWSRSYQGHHYGLASRDIHVDNETVPLMAQWRRNEQAADAVQEVGTLLMRYGMNRTEFYDSLFHGSDKANPNGSVGTQGGGLATLQWHNKAIALASPFHDLHGGRVLPDEVVSLQSSIALANYQTTPTWTLYIDDQPVTTLPARATAANRLYVEDGVTYVALIPIPATDLGRTEEIVVTDGGPPVAMQGGGSLAPTWIINNYNFYRPDAPWKRTEIDGKRVTRAIGGFVIELGDREEYGSFAAFRQQLAEATLDVRWDDATGVAHVTYSSGGDTLEAGYRPEYEDGKAPGDQCFTYRRVNGAWPYLAEGIERETDVSIMGVTGRLEKGGVVVTHQPGRMAYLLTEPRSGTVFVSNPLPDPQYMEVSLAGGERILADGRLGMLQLAYEPGANGGLDVRYAVKEGQSGPEMATALVLDGFDRVPRVTLNDELCAPVVDEAKRIMIPLAAAMPPAAVAANLTRHAPLQSAALAATARREAVLRYDQGEHYILTEPRPGVFSFWMQWPNERRFEAEVSGGVRVTVDGRLALQKLVVDAASAHIAIDYAPYLQTDRSGAPIAERATTVVVFGLTRPPTVTLHGTRYAGEPEAVMIDGARAYCIPLFGEPPAEVKQSLAERLASTAAALAARTP